MKVAGRLVSWHAGWLAGWWAGRLAACRTRRLAGGLAEEVNGAAGQKARGKGCWEVRARREGRRGRAVFVVAGFGGGGGRFIAPAYVDEVACTPKMMSTLTFP